MVSGRQCAARNGQRLGSEKIPGPHSGGGQVSTANVKVVSSKLRSVITFFFLENQGT